MWKKAAMLKELKQRLSLCAFNQCEYELKFWGKFYRFVPILLLVIIFILFNISKTSRYIGIISYLCQYPERKRLIHIQNTRKLSANDLLV